MKLELTQTTKTQVDIITDQPESEIQEIFVKWDEVHIKFYNGETEIHRVKLNEKPQKYLTWEKLDT
jgi:hypothetical protein